MTEITKYLNSENVRYRQAIKIIKIGKTPTKLAMMYSMQFVFNHVKALAFNELIQHVLSLPFEMLLQSMRSIITGESYPLAFPFILI